METLQDHAERTYRSIIEQQTSSRTEQDQRILLLDRVFTPS